MSSKQINQLTEATSAGGDDFFVIEVDQGGGDYVTRKIKKSNLVSGGGGGTNSAALMKTGQVTSYRTGDDGDIQAGRDVDFFNLDFVNFFGHSKRFTGITGGYNDSSAIPNVLDTRDVNGNSTSLSLAFPEGIMLDWSTFDSSTGEVLGYYALGLTDLGTRSFDDNIDFCLAFATASFPTGWRGANRIEICNLFNDEAGWSFQWYPLSLTSFEFWSTTTLAIAPAQGLKCGLFSLVTNAVKSQPNYSMPVRTFNISEL